MEDEIALEQLGNRFSTLAGTVGPRASGFFCSCGKGGQGACHCRRHSRDRRGALSYTGGEWAYLISHVEAPIREEVVVGVHVAGRATPPHLGTKRDTDRTCGPYQDCDDEIDFRDTQEIAAVGRDADPDPSRACLVFQRSIVPPRAACACASWSAGGL